MLDHHEPIKGRGASWNPANRFEPRKYVNQDIDDEPQPRPDTVFLPDRSKSIITYNTSPDVGFDASVNPYRGCEHGCIYCYARPYHEYFGLSAGVDFETQIFVKYDAPTLLRKELASRKWQPQVVAMSGVTDCYQPIERKLRITRGCLEVFAECRNPVAIITKNQLVTRDVDILAELASYGAAAVTISLTTLDVSLNRTLEPRTSLPAQRLAAVCSLHEAGIPVGVMLAPLIPGLTDHEIPALLEAAADAGAQFASYSMLRLPHAVAPLFEHWLGEHYSDRKEKVLNRVRAMRGGALNDAEFGRRMQGTGLFADQISQLFQVACHKAGIDGERAALSTGNFRPLGASQLDLFDGLQ